MKLTMAQKAVLAAIAVMILLILGDIAGIVELPFILLLAALVPLAIAARFILPSLDELKGKSRRR